MKILKTYKYQLRPSESVAQKFNETVGVCRMIYNLCLEYRKMLYRDYGQNRPTKRSKRTGRSLRLDKIGTHQVRQNIIHRMLQTYDNFFKRGARFPKFAKRSFYNS
ncbi:MAG: helix-turn-helix domain-containing protein [Chitinophagales bacterium]|nr:helix-turn-helix domain-containing protein [Bacteroidota bacterium]MCB9043846.1 helix-turn-helix domain-containing protein [Chitinophagales bacterium]